MAYVISATVISAIALTIPFSLRAKLLTAGEMKSPASDKSLFHQMLLYVLPFVIFGVAGALGSHWRAASSGGLGVRGRRWVFMR